ncbi:hypothetical protein [Streptomyces sp. JJ36]|uniref:hypothetical protein n=1 Tax=Streptomyces sp. JJ36 TaxID=2736645 RepID=UPI001F420BBC|nr:hypothetical protein [Streptomyces sp. JJ36]MCF6521714.1 hypothetical protein [Streptomyces sp. JJ36]
METTLQQAPEITDGDGATVFAPEDPEVHEEVYSITDEGRELLNRLAALQGE